MSLSGALTTAVGGLDSQSRALGSLSDNIANSQTVGYKRIETSFSTLLSVSNAREHQPGGVIAKPIRTNDIQGSVQQTSIETNLAVSGDGYFAVSRINGLGAGGVPTFETDPIYTRAGDFNVDSNGFLVNSAGHALNAWPIDAATGVIDKNSLQPVRLTQFRDNPRATSNIDYSANLPSSPNPTFDTDGATAGIQFAPTTVQMFDALGQPHNLEVQWTKLAGNNNQWEARISSSEAGVSVTAPAAAVNITFNVADDAVTGAQAGSILSLGGVAGGVGSGASIPVTVSFAGPAASAVTMNLNLGKFGNAEQLTMFTGNDVEFRSARQDGLPPGSFRSLEIGAQGQMTLNFDNGARRTIFQIPLAQFSNYNGLKLENGNAYSITTDSGAPGFVFPGQGGSGTLVASSVEGSNVDIAAEFTKMIQTQRAYGANTRVITVTSQLLEETNNIIR